MFEKGKQASDGSAGGSASVAPAAGRVKSTAQALLSKLARPSQEKPTIQATRSREDLAATLEAKRQAALAAKAGGASSSDAKSKINTTNAAIQALRDRSGQSSTTVAPPAAKTPVFKRPALPPPKQQQPQPAPAAPKPVTITVPKPSPSRPAAAAQPTDAPAPPATDMNFGANVAAFPVLELNCLSCSRGEDGSAFQVSSASRWPLWVVSCEWRWNRIRC